MQLKRVVVTGLGALSPIGNTLPSFWKNLLQGTSGAAPITKFDASHFRTRFACEIKNFKGSDYFDRKELRKLDLFSQYAIVAANEAIEDSQLLASPVNKDKIGVIWSSGIGGLSTLQDQIRDYIVRGEGVDGFRFSPFLVPKMIVDIAAGHISITHGFRGLNYCVTSACASSTHALIDAFNYIRLGRAHAIVTGGSEASIVETAIGGFGAMKALSTRNDDPTTASRPFDLDRDGFVLGEGAASIVLEEYEHAVKRGAKIYAEMVGGGFSADAYHITAPHPEGAGAVLVMRDALDDAQMQKEEISYVNVHGTSTPLGDVSETNAIKTVFGDHAYQLNISSTKSMTGHLLGASGAIEATAAILAVKHDIIPPTINHFTDDSKLDAKLNFTFNHAEKRTVNAALSNSFGFGGHNASVIFKKMTSSDKFHGNEK